VGHLDRFWRGERGVQEVTQRRRHVAHAELDPKQRDLDYVRCVRLQPQSRLQQLAAPPTQELSTRDMACVGSGWQSAVALLHAPAQQRVSCVGACNSVCRKAVVPAELR
jgi:hypothetical protein